MRSKRHKVLINSAKRIFRFILSAKKTCIYLFFFSTIQLAHAQVQLEDLPTAVLKSKLNQSSPDSGRVVLQLALGRSILFKPGGGQKEIDSSTYFMQQAYQLSNKINYQPGVGNSMLLSALIFNKEGKNDKGLAVSEKALQCFQGIHSKRGIAEAYIIVGQHYSDHDADHDQKIKYYELAAAMFKDGGFKLREATTLMDLADLYQTNRMIIEALKILYEAQNLYKTLNYPRLQGVYNLIARCSMFLGDYTTAVKYHLLAIKTAVAVNDTTIQLARIYMWYGETLRKLEDFPQANLMFNKALKIGVHFHDEPYMSYNMFCLELNAVSVGDFASAEALLNSLSKMKSNQNVNMQRDIETGYLNVFTRAKLIPKASEHANKLKNWLNKTDPEDMTNSDSYFALIKYYLAVKMYSKCYNYLNVESKLINNKKMGNSNRLLELYAFKVDSATGNYSSAIQHHIHFSKIADSLLNINKLNQIASLRIESETEQKNQNIILLTRQSELKDTQLKQARNLKNLLIIASLFFITIIALVYTGYRNKNQNNRLLQTKQKEINAQNSSLQILLTEKNHLLVEKDGLLSEKDLLLKEVNHRVKNNLQMIMSLLESQSAYLNNEAAQRAITESQNRVQALALIHQKLYHQNNVSDVNMKEYISELITYLNDFYSTNENSILISHETDEIILDVSQAIPVGLILNEAITNAIKHAFKERNNGAIHVSFNFTGRQNLKLEVTDNGIGLTMSAGNKNSSSLGMILIKGLIRQLNGELTIGQKNGLSITVQFSKEAFSAIKNMDGKQTSFA
jgi:two-component system, sensor histidine kinase PdtaS